MTANHCLTSHYTYDANGNLTEIICGRYVLQIQEEVVYEEN
jgi:hypothetical protein